MGQKTATTSPENPTSLPPTLYIFSRDSYASVIALWKGREVIIYTQI